MFRVLEDFRACWTKESELTLNVFDAIPDGALAQSINAEHRDLQRMAWHLVESLIEMPGRLGLELEGAHLITAGVMADPPASMSIIRDAYAKASVSLLKSIAAWTDAELSLEDDMYGEKWKRGVSFWVLITHQVHHRGQMTVLMRQAALKVPSIYGPAKEGWSDYGMEAPKI